MLLYISTGDYTVKKQVTWFIRIQKLLQNYYIILQ